jgi:glycosyltransferase involved in cell wall biosynthesis
MPARTGWNEASVNPCLLIPIYNHKETIRGVVNALAYLNLPCLVVDDGSDQETRARLERIREEFPWVEILHLPVNRGKGAALRHGYRAAAQRGFSHAVQLDADGQHEPADVPKLLEAARREPDALVLGDPIFDETAPKSRLYGRRLSQFIVWVETLSFSIHDPLCGFRCFPLERTVRLIDRLTLGDRMEFDPVITVRLVWEGVPVINVPTRVRYFRDGLSHFRLIRDNALITVAYVRLFFGMLARLPVWLWRKRRRPR